MDFASTTVSNDFVYEFTALLVVLKNTWFDTKVKK